MFLRLWKGSKWKLRFAVIVIASFFMLALFSKLVYVSKDGRMPYVRVPAYLISARKINLPIGVAVYADSRKEDLLASRGLSGLNESTFDSNLLLKDHHPVNEKVASKDIEFRGKDGDVFLHSAGKIFNVFIWDEICGENLDNLFNYPLFPYMPSRKRFSKTFKIINYGQNFAIWLVGYFTPLCDGYHKFQLTIKSGNSEVWISTDSSRKNIKLVLSSIGKDRTMVKELKLTKGKRYYFEVFHKQGHQDSKFNIEVTNSNNSCKRTKQILLFEPFMTPETIWSTTTPVVHFDAELLAKLKEKAKSSKSQSQRTKRDDIFKIPFIDEADIVDLLPKCNYEPSYKVKYHLEKYDGVWETHFSSIYPSDHTNITDILSSGERQIIFGNDIMEKSAVMQIVYGIMGVIKQKLPG